MPVCSYFLEGRCRYGDKCWNEHPRGGRNQTARGGGGSVNRVWVNPSQRSGGGVVQPSSFSRGGGDWGRENSGTGRDDRSSNFSFNTQNRFSTLNNTQSGYRRTGGGGGGGGGHGGADDTDQQLEVIEKDMEVWQSSGQWLFSCYSALKASITGFVELSPEELRMEYYTSRATGDLQSYVNSVQQLVNQWRSRVQELTSMSANTRAAMIAELNNPRAQTSSGGGIFSSSSSSSSTTGFESSSTTSGFGSSSSTGFGSSSATSGFGSSSSTGFGSSSTSSGFGSSATSGFGSSSATSGFGSSSTSSGFGSSSTTSGFRVGGFGSSVQSAAGFSFSASSPGFGSTGSQPASSGFGSSAPSASSFSFTDPAGATASKSSAAGFSFSSASAGGPGGSSAAPGGGSFGGFGGGASASGSAEDRKSGGDSLYTPQSELTPDELREFTAKRFTLGQIPLKPPPAELLTV
ncbi:nucleoporin NUP42 [Pangasianodon hypophthalmus]|uniref:nucleoporin NUP42 n=1 Tax=Pangasianodon hypophthalmus TaxID=310915 RepID=UPI002308285C|nr:nucleoporin NUP42 [Pangasianodon hypophthalmus]